MTVPWLSNCSHDPDGWCLPCVSALGRESWDLQEEVRQLTKERDALQSRVTQLEAKLSQIESSQKKLLRLSYEDIVPWHDEDDRY
jgi:hypothetical protein